MRLMEELRLQGYKEEEAARILQAGYRGYGARQLVGEMRYDRALLTIQAGARGRAARRVVQADRRERELKRLRLQGNFELAIEWLDDDRIEQLIKIGEQLGGNGPDFQRRQAQLKKKRDFEARRDGPTFFLDDDDENLLGALRYVPAHVANAARKTADSMADLKSKSQEALPDDPADWPEGEGEECEEAEAEDPALSLIHI